MKNLHTQDATHTPAAYQKGEVSANALLTAGVMIVGLLVAIFLGQRIAHGDYKPLAGIAVIGLSSFIAFSMGKNFWLLIPLGYPFVGGIGILPIPFSYSELAIIGASAIFVVYLCFHRQDLGFRFETLDWLLLANLLFLLQAYLRNPAGLLIASSEIIGSRQYFTIFLSIAAYVVLAHSKVPERWTKYMVWIIALPVLAAGSVDALTTVFPAASKVIYPFYSAVNIEALTDVAGTTSAERRLTGLADLARPLILLLCSLKAPVSFMLPTNPLFFLVFIAALAMVGMSGFRSVLISAGGYIALASTLWRRKQDVVILGAVAVLGVFALAGFQSGGVKLPFPVQRTLSFIPFVDWDEAATAAADDSTQWRVDMWKDALSSDRYIKNKFWGDGLGFRADDFRAIQMAVMGWGGAFTQAQSNEAAMIKGSFHSGPLSTVRVVGFMGLCLFAPTLLYFAFYSWNLARQTYSTPYFSWTLFIVIPLIYLPFHFTFVFGDYKNDMSALIIATGYIKLLQNSFAFWKANQRTFPDRLEKQKEETESKKPSFVFRR